MKQFDPQDQDDIAHLKALEAKPWQISLLKLNPDYVHWAPGDDAMEKMDNIVGSWKEFGPLKLDDWNEVVHFYFSIYRESHRCPTCCGRGYHPQTQAIDDSFSEWKYQITEDEVLALVKHGYLKDFTHDYSDGTGINPRGWHRKTNNFIPTARQVNDWAQKDMIGHDGCARYFLVQARAKRLGIPEQCPQCHQKGYFYDQAPARVRLTLWMLFPRKGRSMGGIIDNITQDDIPDVLAWLEEASRRNAQRFQKTNDALAKLRLNLK